MTKLAQRSGAEARATVGFTEPYRPSVLTFLDAPVRFELFEPTAEPVGRATFPAWSSLSWEERADYVARYCR
jgi:hypothetical protein